MIDFEYTKSDLIYICKSYGITGYSGLKKQQIQELIDDYFKNKKICRKKLNHEIEKNFEKFKNRKLKSKKHALAISYRNTIKKDMKCSTYYE